MRLAPVSSSIGCPRLDPFWHSAVRPLSHYSMRLLCPSSHSLVFTYSFARPQQIGPFTRCSRLGHPQITIVRSEPLGLALSHRSPSARIPVSVPSARTLLGSASPEWLPRIGPPRLGPPRFGPTGLASSAQHPRIGPPGSNPSSSRRPRSPAGLRCLFSMAVALGNGLPNRLVVLALHCLSCSALPGCSVSQHFQCSATLTLDCSDFSLTLFSFVCLLICLLVRVLAQTPLDRHPRLGALRIGHLRSEPLSSDPLGSVSLDRSTDPLRSASLDRTPSAWVHSHRVPSSSARLPRSVPSAWPSSARSPGLAPLGSAWPPLIGLLGSASEAPSDRFGPPLGLVPRLGPARIGPPRIRPVPDWTQLL